ncbi:uncharacterized protein BCR38DRAFT_135358 [Pseudomassariella vexata]|uniref:Ubiquitin-protein ligase sel1 n=1 Tax=Pseudomassariella vexata TaxID=1141098 RepID=A0A1Y2EAM9_9PEZI|nr:uncharacterized protein BCR38DRAFT_135358 [Pseudomassariella vexata]ORY68621.1 hypothetical protein BCR38DRAFT_135358 [Pseudomassariella vexata]
MGFTAANARIGTVMVDALVSRQDRDGDLTDGDVPDGYTLEHGRYVPFWWSRTGLLIKWSVFLGFIILFSAYLIIGYQHAKRRVRKGLKPLGYHRWLLSRHDLARSDPRYAYPQPAYTNYAPAPAPGYYGMQSMPPPVYDPTRPPMYDGTPMPTGGKIDPSQRLSRPEEEYAAPSGPPPPPAASLRPERTGESNNPFTDSRH